MEPVPTNFTAFVQAELKRAKAAYPSLAGPADAMQLINEKVVKLEAALGVNVEDVDPTESLKRLIQMGALAQRAYEDLAHLLHPTPTVPPSGN